MLNANTGLEWMKENLTHCKKVMRATVCHKHIKGRCEDWNEVMLNASKPITEENCMQLDYDKLECKRLHMWWLPYYAHDDCCMHYALYDSCKYGDNCRHHHYPSHSH